MQLHKACTRACTWLDAMDCFQPTANILPTSSTTLEMVTFGSFNVGGLSAAGSVSQDVWALLNPLMGVLPVDITYFFELTESVPWFFGQDPALAERKTNLDAHTILVNQNNHVMRSFPPGRISVTPQELLALAGWEWNLKTLLNGGEFGAVVNCYNDNHDLPPLVWANFEVVYPETRLALCLLTVEERRDASVVKVADPFIGSTFINAHVRIDAYRGNSFFRLASLAQLVVTLISFLVLLNLSTNVAVFFATYCLGPLSKIFRRAHTESFYIIYKIPSLGLALAADFLTLSKLQDAAGVSSFRSALSHEMQRILQTLAPHKPEIAPDFANHIFQKVCDTNHAVMSHLGKEGQAEQVCAYFDLHRKRHFLEWTVLPAQHRSSLRSRISRASSMALMEEDLRLPQPGTVTSNIREVKAEVDALAAESQDEKDEWIEKQREKIQTLLEQLQNVQDRLRARDAASKSYEKDVTRLLRKKDSLQRRCKQVEKQRSKLVEEIWAWRQRAIYDPNSTDTPPPTFATSSFPLSIWVFWISHSSNHWHIVEMLARNVEHWGTSCKMAWPSQTAERPSRPLVQTCLAHVRKSIEDRHHFRCGHTPRHLQTAWGATHHATAGKISSSGTSTRERRHQDLRPNPGECMGEQQLICHGWPRFEHMHAAYVHSKFKIIILLCYLKTLVHRTISRMQAETRPEPRTGGYGLWLTTSLQLFMPQAGAKYRGETRVYFNRVQSAGPALWFRIDRFWTPATKV